MPPLTFFVMSDLHAFDSGHAGDRRPSFFDVGQTVASGDNPVQDLKSLMQGAGAIKADYLVFCGDLADQAYPTAIERAWKELQEIKTLLGARRILATVGNHDLDSRNGHNDYDAKGCLLDLTPNFPLLDETENTQFWTHHFVIHEPADTSARFVILNSSGYHGEAKVQDVKEYEHGRISKRTLSRLTNSLRSRARKAANIVIVHHHPQKQNELKQGDYDDMMGGYELLQALDPVAHGPWLVIHGHKHFPKISYAQGSGTTPVVFSTGSCAAIPYPEIASRVGQQVYLISVQIDDSPATNCYGTFRTWDWAPGRGWDKAQIRSGLPAHGGFGYRGDIGEMAKEIATIHPAGNKDWRKVEELSPALRFLIPADRDTLVRILETQFQYRFEINREGAPILFQK